LAKHGGGGVGIVAQVSSEQRASFRTCLSGRMPRVRLPTI
jgi:hypothetical protein